jgi:hypothetical protein
MLCRNCKYFVPNNNYVVFEQRLKKGYCNHPLLQVVDNVSGIVHLEEARVVRDNEELCGPDAKLYVEEKNIVSIYFRGINVKGISQGLILYSLFCFFMCILLLKATLVLING